MKIAIVSSSFYGFYEQALLQNALSLKPVNKEIDIIPEIKNAFDIKFWKTKFNDIDILVAIVPGGLEIPQAMNWILQKESIDGVLGLGCIIKGQTTHFEHVCNEVMRGITKLALKTSIPITSAIITSLNDDDAKERVVFDGKNLGKKAFNGLLQMIKLQRQI